ncbi:MAG: DUF3179 domain-containing protein [Planctomycetes bacterium]|nr:DUF3179 domain-containing protein [Planctomycetota bacterium]
MLRLTRTDWIQLGAVTVCGLGVALGLIVYGGFHRDIQAWSEPPPQINAAPPQGTGEFRPQVVIKRRFRPITKFPIATAKLAAGKINDADLVLGVAIEGEARAYPINMLTGPSREILNDALGGRAIAATW